MVYRFGVFIFDDRATLLTRADREIALEPQPARALALLLARAGDVVSREELRAHLWGGDTHVDFDRGLAYCIGELRSALGDTADNPRFVETLPRRGFRFIAPVEAVNIAEVASAAPVVSAASTVPPNTAPTFRFIGIPIPSYPLPFRLRMLLLGAGVIAALTIAAAGYAVRRVVTHAARP